MLVAQVRPVGGQRRRCGVCRRLYGSFLWLLFYLLLGRGNQGIGRYTGAVSAVQGWVTGAIPAAVLLTGYWGRNDALTATILAIFGVVVFVGLYIPLRPKGARTPAAPTSSSAAAV